MKLIHTILLPFWFAIQLAYRYHRVRSSGDKRLVKVFELAHKLHYTQRRKYTGEPYLFHLDNVVQILKKNKFCSTQTLSIAYLHDTLEDVDGMTADKLKLLLTPIFNDALEVNIIVCGVKVLSDYYTKKNFPHLNRRARKELEIALFQKESISQTRSVKLADLIDNTKSIFKEDKNFFYSTYQREAQVYLDVCNDKSTIRLHAILDSFLNVVGSGEEKKAYIQT